MLRQLAEAERRCAVGEDARRAATSCSSGKRACRRDEPVPGRCAGCSPPGSRRTALMPLTLARAGEAAEDDREDEHAAVHDLQIARVDLKRDEQVARAGRSRRRRAAARTGRRGRPRATCRRARPPRSRAACTSTTRLGVRRARQRDQGDAADAGEQPAERVGDDPHGGDVDAAGERGRVVPADGVERPPVRRRARGRPDQRAGSRA